MTTTTTAAAAAERSTWRMKGREEELKGEGGEQVEEASRREHADSDISMRERAGEQDSKAYDSPTVSPGRQAGRQTDRQTDRQIYFQPASQPASRRRAQGSPDPDPDRRPGEACCSVSKAGEGGRGRTGTVSKTNRRRGSESSPRESCQHERSLTQPASVRGSIRSPIRSFVRSFIRFAVNNINNRHR